MVVRIVFLRKKRQLCKKINAFRGRDNVRFHEKYWGVLSNYRLLEENGYIFINRT